jgi:hypothetical protein
MPIKLILKVYRSSSSLDPYSQSSNADQTHIKSISSLETYSESSYQIHLVAY